MSLPNTPIKTATDEELMQRAFDLLDPFVRRGWTVAQVVDVFDATGVFFDNDAAVAFDKSHYRIVGYREEEMTGIRLSPWSSPSRPTRFPSMSRTYGRRSSGPVCKV